MQQFFAIFRRALGPLGLRDRTFACSGLCAVFRSTCACAPRLDCLTTDAISRTRALPTPRGEGGAYKTCASAKLRGPGLQEGAVQPGRRLRRFHVYSLAFHGELWVFVVEPRRRAAKVSSRARWTSAAGGPAGREIRLSPGWSCRLRRCAHEYEREHAAARCCFLALLRSDNFLLLSAFLPHLAPPLRSCRSGLFSVDLPLNTFRVGTGRPRDVGFGSCWDMGALRRGARAQCSSRRRQSN